MKKKFIKSIMLGLMLLSIIGCNREEVTGDMPEDGLMPTVSENAEQESSIISENITEEDEVQQTEAEESESITLEGYDSVEPQDGGYKMFYGTWEFTELMYEHRSVLEEDNDNILGWQVTYLPTLYECHGMYIENPHYNIQIFPAKYPTSFFNDLGNLDVLMPDSSFYVWTMIVDKPPSRLAGYYEGMDYESEIFTGAEFFVKDDNTLFSFANNCIYKLTRVSYPEEYDESTNTELTISENGSYYNKYRLFYGTWEFANLIYEDESVAGEDNERILGEQVEYSLTGYECSGVSIENLRYVFTILPKTEDYVKELLPNGEFAVWVEVAGESDIESEYGDEVYIGGNLLLKDDNTMYCFTNNCVYELRRVSYMDDYCEDDVTSYREDW